MVGHSIMLNNNAYQVIGVMPPAFSFPKQSEIWIPMSVPTTPQTFEAFRGFLPTEIIARLAPGVTAEAASKQLLAHWRRGMSPDSSIANQSGIPDIIAELAGSRTSERQGRMIDHGTGGSMERKKHEGYF